MIESGEKRRYSDESDSKSQNQCGVVQFAGSDQKYLQNDQLASNLAILSPFIYVNHPRQSLYLQSTADMTLIETPAPNTMRSSYLEQIDEGMKSISRVIIWANDLCQEENSENSQDSDDSSFTSEIKYSKLGEFEEIMFEPTESMWGQKPMEAHHKNILLKDSTKNRVPKLGNEEAKKSSGPRKTCNCKKTQCLKLYCDCFRENKKCEGCACVGCHNTEQFSYQRSNARIILIDRNPQAFKPKIQSHSHAIGCNCKKSSCQKRYCECFQAGLACGDNCKCEDCKNFDTECSKRVPKKIRRNIPANFKLLNKTGPPSIVPVGQIQSQGLLAAFNNK